MQCFITFFITIVFLVCSVSLQQLLVPQTETRASNIVVWCTGNSVEQTKCLRFAQAVKRVPTFTVTLLCKKAADREQCMNLLDSGGADLVTLDPGEVLVAGRYHSLVPIMAERYGTSKEDGYYAVAVVHGSSDFRDLNDLRDKKACFPGVGQFAGWVLPLATLIERHILNITDCNNLVKSASDFFGPSCAPGSLIDKYNPSGDNPQKMCELCQGYKGERCSASDPYAQFDGAFKCLQEGGGQVAFLKHTTVQEMTNKSWYLGPPRYDFRLLCPSGVTASLDDYQRCNWGFVPANAVVTLSSALPERRRFFQDFHIYSLGILLHQVETRTIPFHELHPHTIIYRVVSLQARPPLPEATDRGYYWETVAQCWHEDQRKRLSASQVLYRICHSHEPSLY